MQISCRNCNRPFGLNQEEVVAALTAVYQEDLKYFNAHCPHCGKQNRVTKKNLHKAAPGWKYEPVEEKPAS